MLSSACLRPWEGMQEPAPQLWVREAGERPLTQVHLGESSHPNLPVLGLGTSM